MGIRSAHFALLLPAATFFCTSGLAQTGSAVPAITIAVSPLVIGSPTTVQVLVTNPAFSPVPTGQVSLDFGDRSAPAPLNLAYTWAGTTHTYGFPGEFKVRANYSGDANFAPATSSLTVVDAASAPVYTLQAFGDSMTAGQTWGWPVLLTEALGWELNLQSCGGCKTNDMVPAIYDSVVDGFFVSTWLLGQNDSPGSAAGQDQLQRATLAQSAWLAIPEGPAKQRAQASTVSQSGDWVPSDIYPTTGLVSDRHGSSLTAAVPGDVVYLGLTSTLTSDYTVRVSIDGVDRGRLSPVSVYVGEHQSPESYGARYAVGGGSNGRHFVRVECVNPGTSGCYVDWIGGNGIAPHANLPPYVFTAVSYSTEQPDTNGLMEVRQQIVRNVVGQLQADGLPVHLVDIASLYNGPALPACVSDDLVHPNQCGNQLEETVFLSAADFLTTAHGCDCGRTGDLENGTCRPGPDRDFHPCFRAWNAGW